MNVIFIITIHFLLKDHTFLHKSTLFYSFGYFQNVFFSKYLFVLIAFHHLIHNVSYC